MLDELQQLKIDLSILESKKDTQNISISQLDIIYREINRIKILIKKLEN